MKQTKKGKGGYTQIISEQLYQTRIIRTRFKAANLRSYCVKCLVPV